MLTPEERAKRYDSEHAPILRALAYRMLGSRSEAEDIVQEAWLRWAEVDECTVQHIGAYLSRLVTNLCLDRLRSASAKREQYVGVWLPEPLLDEEGWWEPGPDLQTEFAQDVSVAFMLALERLSPLERAAFLLHDVFDFDFDEIGLRLQRSPTACRQLASRARNYVKADYARREVEDEERKRLFDAFTKAVRNFDVDALANLLTEDAVLLSDGGGKVSSVPLPLHGNILIAITLIEFAIMTTAQWRLEPARINGLPGCLVFDDATGQLVQTITMSPSLNEFGHIGALYVQRNPDKLKGVLTVLGRNSVVA